MAVFQENIFNKNRIDAIKPKTYFDELAEYGYLVEYLKNNFPEKFSNDIEFRDEMYNVLYTKSNKAIPEVELLYLNELFNCLKYFLELTKTCWNPTQ